MTGEAKKKMRVDRRKNVEKVAIAKIKKPLSTQREIAKATWVWLWTVNRAEQEMEQIGTKDERILTLTDTDFEIMVLAQGRIKDKLQDDSEMKKTRIWEISSVAKESAARYTTFRGAVTDPSWWLNNILTPKQLEAIDALKDFL